MDLYNKCKNEYIKLINKYRNNTIILPEWKVFEYLCAIHNNMLVWELLPPIDLNLDIDFSNILSNYNLPSLYDYGIDLINLDLTNSAQCKYYKNNSRISWTDISKFHSLSFRLNIKNMYLFSIIESKIDKRVIDFNKFANISDIKYDFDNLLNSIPIIDYDTIKDNKIISKIEQRPYTKECTDLFINTDKKLYRYELPPGTGKSFIMMNINLISGSNSRDIIFVPWIDLAEQMYKDAKNLNINVCLIGNNNKHFNLDSNLIICIYQSVHLLPDNLHIRYLFIDEAHHIENNDSKIYNKIKSKIKNYEKELHLSGTFKNNTELDYKMSLRDAINDGWLTDYRFLVEYFDSDVIYSLHDKLNSLVDLIVKNQDWFPIFIYFNNTEKSKLFNQLLLSKNISSNYLTGDSSDYERKKVINDIKTYKLNVLCLCGVFNEGISIDNLKTVIFGDLRHSDINKKQIALRGSRLHYDKPYFNIVLPLYQENINDTENTDLPDFIRTFFLIDPSLRQNLNKSSKNINNRFTFRRNGNYINDNDNDIKNKKSILICEKIFENISNICIEYISPLEKAEILLEYVKVNNKIPPRSYITETGIKLGLFWVNIKQGQNTQIYNDILSKNEILRNDYERVQNLKKEKEGKKIYTPEEKAEILLEYVKVNNKIPPFSYITETGIKLGQFWGKIKQGQNTQIYNDNLNKNEILRNDYERLQKLKKEKEGKK